MAVYLLHFDPPYKHARHYIGYTDNLIRRLDEHRKGNGARLVQVALDAGHTFRVARIWPDAGRDIERRIKRCKDADHFCPICNPLTAENNGQW